MAELLRPQRLSDIRALEREWLALRECVSPWSNKERLRQYLAAVDWPRLLLLAREHGVLGQLSTCMSDRDAFAISSEIKQALAEHRRTQNFLTLRLTGELFRVLELFKQNEIRALVVKGPVLAVEAYADPGMRSYGDLDLLVRQRDIQRATELLMASSYQAAVSLDAIRAGRIPGQYLFCKRDANLLVELHNDLTLRYFPRPLPIEDFFARQICVSLDEHEVPAPHSKIISCLFASMARNISGKDSAGSRMLRVWSRSKRASIGNAPEHPQKRSRRTVCSTPACGLLWMFSVPNFPNRSRQA